MIMVKAMPDRLDFGSVENTPMPRLMVKSEIHFVLLDVLSRIPS
jgi:hypothetical protein